MEHDEAAATDRIEGRADFGGQRCHFFPRGGGVGEIGACIVGIRGRQLGRDFIQPNARILRGQPSMGIMLAMGVIVMSRMVLMLVMPVIVVLFFVVIVVIMPVIIVLRMLFFVMVMIVMPMVIMLCMFLFVMIVIVIVIMLGMFFFIVIMAFMPVIIMLRMLFFVVVMIVMIRVFFLAMVMVVMTVLIVIVMPMIVMITVVMRLKESVFAEVEQLDVFDCEQFGDRGICGQCLNRIFELRGQVLADPEHHIGLLQRGRVGGAQVVAMRGRTGLHDQVRGADAVHHTRDQRMHRRDINRNARNIRHGCATEQHGGN